MPRYLVNIIYVVFVKIFLEKISIWFCRLSKDLPSPMWMGISQSIEGQIRTKRKREGWTPFLFLSWNVYLFFCPWTLELVVLGPLDSKTHTCSPRFLGFQPWTGNYTTCFLGYQAFRLTDQIIPLTFLVLELADNSLWDFWASMTSWNMTQFL